VAKPVRLVDVARQVGLSEATVSLALNGKPQVNPATRRRVVEAARRMGYLPNAAARSLARAASGRIGLIVPDLANPYYGLLAQQVGRQVARRGYGLLLVSPDDDGTAEADLVDQLISDRVDGVLIAPSASAQTVAAYTERLAAYAVRYLFVCAGVPGLELPVVMGDLEQGAYLMADHLLGLGHERLRLIGVPAGAPTAHRLAGVRRAYAARGMTPPANLLLPCREASFLAAYETVRALEPLPEALMAINDVMALGALRALTERGIAVPGRVSLAGYDDVAFSATAATPLSTVAQNLPALADRAVERLLEMIGAGAQQPVSERIAPHLVVRASTGPRPEPPELSPAAGPRPEPQALSPSTGPRLAAGPRPAAQEIPPCVS
jgi:LacI family transcriptional regulator